MTEGRRRSFLVTLLLLGGAALGVVHAQGDSAARKDSTPAAGLEALKGRWVRSDGGYMIAISSVAPDGKLDAAYSNPRPLPFAVAQAKQEGGTVKVFLELRAGGYNGSTYTLAFDPAADMLKGVYFQAPTGRSYDVTFVRVR